MKTAQTLRTRIVLYFCGYLALMLCIYSGAIIVSFNYAEDLSFNRQVSQITARLLKYQQDHGGMPPNLPVNVTAYEGIGNVPSDLRRFVQGRKPDLFEVDSGDLDFHIAIAPLPSSDKRLYVFYDVGSIEAADWLQSVIRFSLLAIGLGVLLIGWLLARTLSNRILNPISRLVNEVESLSLEKDSARLSEFNTPDEVGALARTINRLLKRIADFTRREREFTSHASHELRTPITVVKGAAEILSARSEAGDKAIQRPLARITRAVKDMEMLVDTFLLLARQGLKPDRAETCDLPVVAQKVMESYAYLLEGKPVKALVKDQDSRPIQAPASLLTIALGNLVRNAFQYTRLGEVEIITLPDRVRVLDSGPGIESNGQGAGLGLTIVRRLCERMNWSFSIEGSIGRGTRAELIFSSLEKTAESPEAEPG